MARRTDFTRRNDNFYANSKKRSIEEIRQGPPKKLKKIVQHDLAPKPFEPFGLDKAVLYVNGERIGATLNGITPEPPKFVVDEATIKGLMARFTYKPNWHFTVYSRYGIDINQDDVFLKIEFYAENSVTDFDPWRLEPAPEPDSWAFDPYYGGPRFRGRLMQPNRPVIPVGATLKVPPYIRSEEEFWNWLRMDVITYAENHERDEWFKVDKGVPFDPHAMEKAMAKQRAADRRAAVERSHRRYEEAVRKEYGEPVPYHPPTPTRSGPPRFPQASDTVPKSKKPVVFYDEAFKMDDAMVKSILEKSGSDLKKVLSRNAFEKRA